MEYLFSTQARSVNGACDQTYTTNISTYVYVNGNLCLSGTNGMITDPSNNNKVEANGSITLASTTNTWSEHRLDRDAEVEPRLQVQRRRPRASLHERLEPPVLREHQCVERHD